MCPKSVTTPFVASRTRSQPRISSNASIDAAPEPGLVLQHPVGHTEDVVVDLEEPLRVSGQDGDVVDATQQHESSLSPPHALVTRSARGSAGVKLTSPVNIAPANR
jgi:hypothetical protein